MKQGKLGLMLAISMIAGLNAEYVNNKILVESTEFKPKAKHIKHQGNKERARRLKRKTKEI